MVSYICIGQVKNHVLEDLYIWMQAFEIFIATSTAHSDQSLICIPISCFWLNVMSHDQMLYNIGLECFPHIYICLEYVTIVLTSSVT